MPADPTYLEAAERFFTAALEAGREEPFHQSELNHRRGSFPALPFGISYGNGHTYVRRSGTKGHDELVQQLLENKDLARLASYADSTCCSQPGV